MLNVCSSGFYAWLQRGESRRRREDAKLLQRIREVFARSRQTYGSPRIWAELCVTGWRVSRKRVARLMRLDGMYALRKRAYRRRKKSLSGSAAAPNLLQQDFSATDSNQKWLADIVQIGTAEGRLHLAVVLDAYSRKNRRLVHEADGRQQLGSKCPENGAGSATDPRTAHPS